MSLLIFGGTGSLGHILVERFSEYDITIFSRDETKQYLMRQKYPHIRFEIGCIRNKHRVEHVLLKTNPTLVIIASALKHIDICEANIGECIDTNILGVKNIIDAIQLHSSALSNLETCVFVSTDKACSPINVYGMSKAISEKMMIAKSLEMTRPKFVNVRYGNVINSRGSLFPRLREIAEDNSLQSFTLTHPDMTRFFMTLEESALLIRDAIRIGQSGDTIVPYISSYKILDILEMFSKEYNKPISIIGLRAGERMCEILVNETECQRMFMIENVYVIPPIFKRSNAMFLGEGIVYSSDNCIADASELEMYI